MLPSNLKCRSIGPCDMPFLRGLLYASTGELEMAHTTWSADEIDRFLTLQFEIQHSYYQKLPAVASTTSGSGTPGPTANLGPIAAGGRAGTLYTSDPATTTVLPFNAGVTEQPAEASPCQSVIPTWERIS